MEGNPVNLTDPTGMFPDWCKSMSSRVQYEDCVRKYYHLLTPYKYQTFPNPEGTPGCWSGPVAYRAPGFVEGYSASFNSGISVGRGTESVFDFATMERAKFNYETRGFSLETSVSIMGYHGLIFGFNNVEPIEDKYKGDFYFLSSGFNSSDFLGGISLGVGVVGFVGSDWELTGISEYYSIGAGVTWIPGGSIAGGVGHSTWTGQQKTGYVESGGVNRPHLQQDIAFNPDSPFVLHLLPSHLIKWDALILSKHYAWIHDEIYIMSK